MRSFPSLRHGMAALMIQALSMAAFGNTKPVVSVPPNTPAGTMRLANFNTGLAHGSVAYAEERLPEITKSLQNLDIDVLCLNEVWRQDDQEKIKKDLLSSFPHSYAQRSSQNFLHYAQGSNGLLVLSKYPIRRQEIRRFDAFFIQRAALVVEIAAPGNTSYRVGCTHLSTDLPYLPYLGSFKNWDSELMEQIRLITQWRDVDAIIGDFNAGPERPGKIASFKLQAYTSLIQAGLYSPYADSTNATCTWCADNVLAGGKESYIIDHVIFYRPASIKRAWRLLYDDIIINGKNLKLSDHAGVAVEIAYP